MDTFLGPWDGSGRADSYETIAQYWKHFNYTFFIVYPPEQEAVIENILGPAFLDPISMWQNAALGAQAETEADPDDAFAWFNLGSSLTQMGTMTGQTEFFNSAVIAFDKAREIGLPARMLWYQFDPYIAYLAAGRIEDVLLLTSVTLNNEGGQNVEETYLYLGHAYLAKGDIIRARSAYREARRLNTSFAQAQLALESLD